MSSRIGFAVLALSCALSVARADDGPFTWLHRFESTNNATIMGVQTDRGGSIYVVGNYQGSVKVADRELPYALTSDIFAVKLTRHGKPVWVEVLDTGTDDGVTRMDVDDNGDLFLCGVWGTNAVIDGVNVALGPFVARFGRKLLWSATFATHQDQGSVASVTISPKDRSIWALGAKYLRLYLKHYSSDGSLLLEAFLSNNWYAYPMDVAADSFGNVFITGATSYSIYDDRTFAIGDRTNVAAYIPARQFTAAFDSQAKLKWLTGVPSQWMGIDSGWGHAISATPDGSVISAGRVLQSAGGIPYSYAFVSKHSADGTLLWMQKRGEHRGAYTALDVASDSKGNAIATGFAHGYGFDPNSRTGVMLSAYDSATGAMFSDYRINSVGPQEANSGTSVCVDRKGNAIVAGYLTGSPIIGTNVLPWRSSSPFVGSVPYESPH